MNGTRSRDRQKSLASEAECVQGIPRAVARGEDEEVLDLPPLGRTVDVEALETLLGRSESERLTVEFEYCGYTVVARNDGYVSVADRQ